MNRSRRRWSVIAALIIIVIAIWSVADHYISIDRKYNYHAEFFKKMPCPWLFADSAKTGIESMFLSGWIRNNDQIYTYVYEHDYYILAWNIPALRNVNLKNVVINHGVYLDHVEMRGEILDAGTGLETKVRYGPFFKDKIVVDLDEYSKVFKTFETSYYRGFYGTASKIAFENGKGQILAMRDYTRRIMPTLFVMYKTKKSFYIILINSKKPFGVNMLKILNLK